MPALQLAGDDSAAGRRLPAPAGDPRLEPAQAVAVAHQASSSVIDPAWAVMGSQHHKMLAQNCELRKRGKTPDEQAQHYQAQQSKTADSRHFPAGGGAKLNSFGENRPGFCPGYRTAKFVCRCQDHRGRRNRSGLVRARESWLSQWTRVRTLRARCPRLPPAWRRSHAASAMV
jgi:hypothetical protein